MGPNPQPLYNSDDFAPPQESKEQKRQREERNLQRRNELLKQAMEREKERQAFLPAHLRDPFKTHLITIRQPNRNIHVNACRHDMDPRYQPKHTNCPTCWTAFFMVNQIELLAAEKIIESFGEQAVINKYGNKYLKHLKAAIALQQLRRQQEQNQPDAGEEQSSEATSN